MKGLVKEYYLMLLGSKILVNSNVYDGKRVVAADKFKIDAADLAKARERIEAEGYRLNKSYSNVA